MAYSFKDAIGKIGRVITSGRGADYFKRGKSLASDIYKDYSTPSMGKRRRRRRSTPKMGKRKRRR